MPVVLRLWAPPDAPSASAETGDTLATAIEGIAEGRPPQLLEYVESCDVNAHRGRGDVKLTRGLAKAKRFPDFEAAMAYWKRQSTVRPLRPDGKPNRPLTAYNVTMENVP
jgi:hypothetical protein